MTGNALQVRGKDAARGNVHRSVCALVLLVKCTADTVRECSADFLNHLIKKLPEGIAVFNRRASSYTPTETGVQIHFENEGVPPFETDVLICSDGIKSLLRGCLYQRKGLDMDFQRARYAEWIAWRGLIPREKYNAIFGDEAPENIMHCGQGRHILSASLPFSL